MGCEQPLMSTELQAHLKNHFQDGSLSIFCGAGISVGAGLPDWPTLLRSLLVEFFQSQEIVGGRNRVSAYFTITFEQGVKKSPLIIAQSLKNHFGDKFNEHVRKALYIPGGKSNDSTANSTAIGAIRKLCEPIRGQTKISSILTYNYDDLIEMEFKNNGIRHISMHKEGLRSRREQVTIYHVHGYLPRDGVLDAGHNIVLSEDAYHDQFLNPFSWSNLVQLMLLRENNCLLLGISLTDPNLRRLLDVARNKDPLTIPDHYIVLKRHTRKELEATRPLVNLADVLWAQFLSIIHSTEENDAKKLGLNVIWVDEYDEIPDLLGGIRDNG